MGLLSSDNSDKVVQLEKKIADLESQLGNKSSNELIKTLYKWDAPERVFVARTKDWFLKVSMIFLFIILFLAFMGEIILIILAISLVFLIFIMATVPPESVAHEITTKGLKVSGKFYKWSALDSFWFTKKYDFVLLNIDTNLSMPSRLILLLDYKKMRMIDDKESPYSSDIEDISNLLGRYIEIKVFDENIKQSKFSELTEGKIIQ